MRHSSFGTAGFVALALTTTLLGACSSSNSVTGTGAGMGRVRMVIGGGTSGAAGGMSTVALNDGTGRTITSAQITLSSILARNLDGHLIDVTVDMPFTLDLVSVIQGGTVDLPMGALPAGTYDQIVIVIRSLHVVLSDGTQIDVTPPGGGWTAIVPTQQFDVVDGQTTTVHLAFHASGAFQWINGQLNFNPGFDCEGVDNNEQDSRRR